MSDVVDNELDEDTPLSRVIEPAESQTSFSDELSNSMMEYGTYINASRALPNVLDGLKPVHRRVIWAMYTGRYYKSVVKSASVVGDVMGKYHPHGDSAIYDTMTNMAHVEDDGKVFKNNIPFIDGQGSWGDFWDGPAAMRYTECRMNQNALAMVGMDENVTGASAAEIDEGTVDLFPNYDGKRKEPVHALPSLFPNFVVNSTSGIGYGISTTTAPHNIKEVLNLAIKLVDTPTPRWETIQDIMPGPDVPADCFIFDADTENYNIRSYMETGYGKFIMRARMELEEYDITSRRKGHKWVVTGLPYKVAPESVVGGIANMVNQARLPEDISADNYSDSNGIRIEIDCHENDPYSVQKRLLHHGSDHGSYLQMSYNVNANAIVDGRIQQIGVIDALRRWVDHRRTMIRRRSKFRINKAKDRLEIVEGFLIAIPDAEEIIDIIRKSMNRQEAEESLQKSRWGFTERQSVAILDMTLSRLTRMSTQQFEDERDRLNALIDECQEILDDTDKRLKYEMRRVRDSYGDSRRSEMQAGTAYVELPDEPAIEIPANDIYLIRSHGNWVRQAARPTVNNTVGRDDYVTEKIKLTDQNRLEGISTLGYHYRISCGDLPTKMTNSSALFSDLDSGENLVMVDSAAQFGEPVDLVMIAQDKSTHRDPVIKRVGWDDWATLREGKYRPLVRLNDDMYVSNAFFLKQSDDVAVITAEGRMLRISNEDVVAKGRSAAGNPVVRLDTDEADEVIWSGPISSGQSIVVQDVNGHVAMFDADKVPSAGRNTSGKVITRSGFYLSHAYVVDNPDQQKLFVYDGEGEPQEIDLSTLPVGTNLNNDKMLKIDDDLSSMRVWIA